MLGDQKMNCLVCGQPLSMYFKPLCLWCKPEPELRKVMYLGAAIEHLARHHGFNAHEAFGAFLEQDPNLSNRSFLSIRWDEMGADWLTRQHEDLYVRVLRLLTEAYPDPTILWLVAW